jgi:hypothetical protein
MASTAPDRLHIRERLHQVLGDPGDGGLAAALELALYNASIAAADAAQVSRSWRNPRFGSVSSQGQGMQTAGQRAARPPTRWCGRSPGPQQRWPQRCRQGGCAG